MVGFIGDNANGVAKLADERIRLLERHAGKTGHCRRGDGLTVFGERFHHLVVAEAIAASFLPRSAHHLWLNLNVVQLHIVPENDFWRLREHSQVELLSIAVHTHIDATGIHPSTAVLARGNVVEVADDVIAQVVLQMLGRRGVACLSTSPDTVEVGWFLLKIEARAVEVVIPIGVLDDDLHLRIHLLCWLNDKLTPSIGHQSEAVLRPTLRALGGNLVVVLQVDEEEVVEDKVVEKLSRIFCNLPDNLPLVRTGIAVSLKVLRLRTGVGDAATDLKTFR